MNTNKGFTLIELMIALAIVAILAAVAVPNYQSYMIKTRRVIAGACLIELSQFMERFYSMNLRYDKDKDGTDVALPNTQCRTDLNGYYTFSIATTPAIAARSYVLQAVPQGAQSSKDPKACGTLTINQTGQKTAAGATTKVADCW